MLIFVCYPGALELNNNGFTGAIPTQIGLLTQLTILSLNGNELSGEIPSEIGNLVALGKRLYTCTSLLPGHQLFWLYDKSSNPRPLPYQFTETFTMQDNLLTGRPPVEMCMLRDSQVETMIADCPARESGVLCPIPNCCTSCEMNPSTL
jgi:hypothetical protein